MRMKSLYLFILPFASIPDRECVDAPTQVSRDRGLVVVLEKPREANAVLLEDPGGVMIKISL